MFEKILLQQNPHWDGVLYEPGIRRSSFATLLEFMSTRMIVALMGVRRAGKSTCLKQLINHLITQENVDPRSILFLNVEHPYFVQYAHDIVNLEKIFDDYIRMCAPKGKIYCFLDEVQFFQKWEVFVKAHFESNQIKFVITGSNSALLVSELMTLLSGRALSLDIYPLSFEEIVQFHKIDCTDRIKVTKARHELQKLYQEYLQYGGFPEIISLKNRNLSYNLLNAYAKSILYQDVAPRLEVKHSVALEKLFVYLISHVGKPFSYHKLASLFSLSDKHIKEFIKGFSDAYLLFELDIFAYSLQKQIRNPKKIYSIDVGQVQAASFAFSENRGRILENAIFLELKRRGCELYYYKTKTGLEIDFLAKHEGQYALIQVAWSLTDHETKEREVKALFMAMDEMQINKALIVTIEEEEVITQNDKEVTVVPAYAFCTNQSYCPKGKNC